MGDVTHAVDQAGQETRFTERSLLDSRPRVPWNLGKWPDTFRAATRSLPFHRSDLSEVRYTETLRGSIDGSLHGDPTRVVSPIGSERSTISSPRAINRQSVPR